MKNRFLNLLLTGSIVSSVMLSSCEKYEIGTPDNPDFSQEKGEFKDSRDGKIYKWVKIGEQIWMAENLNYTGSDIRHLPGPDWANNPDADGWCYYDSSEVNGKTYGALYQWEAAKTACPPGWHLPTDEEWAQLEKYLTENGFSYDGVIGNEGIAKSLATDYGWHESTETGAIGSSDFSEFRNITGFSALPGGGRGNHGGFGGLGYEGTWWTATEYTSSLVYRRCLNYNQANVIHAEEYKTFGCSVRCVKD